MIKIINKKKYDTEKSQRIATESYLYPNDFHYWKESLYRSPKGQYFIYGEGGAMSMYSRSLGSTTTGGEGWKLLSDNEAYLWLENFEFTEEIEKFFNDQIEEG